MKIMTPIVILLIGFSFGCAQPYIVGKAIEPSKVDQIVPGTTSENKVVEIFGQPTKKETIAGGGMRYDYSYYQEIPQIWTKTIQQKDTLEIFIQRGVVQKYDLKKEGINPAKE